jgi:hypothetical protein
MRTTITAAAIFITLLLMSIFLPMTATAEGIEKICAGV